MRLWRLYDRKENNRDNLTAYDFNVQYFDDEKNRVVFSGEWIILSFGIK